MKLGKKIPTSRLAVFFPNRNTGNNFFLKGGLKKSKYWFFSSSHYYISSLNNDFNSDGLTSPQLPARPESGVLQCEVVPSAAQQSETGPSED